MSAAFAAAASSSMFAPCSVPTRRLMIDANPIFFSSGPASAFVAPPQATVVSSFAKLVTPATAGFVTCWADANGAPVNSETARTSERFSIMISPLKKEQRDHHNSLIMPADSEVLKFSVLGSRFCGSAFSVLRFCGSPEPRTESREPRTLVLVDGDRDRLQYPDGHRRPCGQGRRAALA